MASLARLQQQFPDQALRVLPLNQDLDDPAAIKQLLTQYDAGSLPAYRDPDSRLGRALGQTLLPTTLVIGPDGTLIDTLIGPAEWDDSHLVTKLQQLLPASPLR